MASFSALDFPLRHSLLGMSGSTEHSLLLSKVFESFIISARSSSEFSLSIDEMSLMSECISDTLLSRVDPRSLFNCSMSALLGFESLSFLLSKSVYVSRLPALVPEVHGLLSTSGS